MLHEPTFWEHYASSVHIGIVQHVHDTLLRCYGSANPINVALATINLLDCAFLLGEIEIFLELSWAISTKRLTYHEHQPVPA